MTTRRVLGAALIALALGLGMMHAALIQPELVSTLANASADQKYPVEFFMKLQANALSLDASIPDLPKPQRRARVAAVLQQHSAATQADLLAYLNTAAGKVDDVRSFWLCNMVSCWATKDVIYEVAARNDVDLVVYSRVPVELGKLNLNAPIPPNDGIEPNMVTTNVRGAWKQGYHGEGVVLGVVDTGVWYTHDDLTNHLWQSTVYPNHGFNYASYQFSSGHPGPSSYDTLTPLDYYGHGTHCSGIATADGAYGNGTNDTMGIAPATMLMCLPVDVYLHSPYPDTSMENNTIAGFQFCVSPPRDPTNGADAITTSLGLVSGWLPRRAIFRAVEENINAAGLPHAVAAGNEGPSARTIRCPGDCPPPWPNPANHPTDHAVSAVITVGATDNNDNAAGFTSIGPTDWGGVSPYNDYAYPPGLMDPDVCAPGVDILSTYYNGNRAYTTMSGTSMATPGVAGLICLMLSKNPTMTPRVVDSILEVCAVTDLGPGGKDVTFGAGRINCSLAVQYTPVAGPNHNLALASLIAPLAKVDPATPITPKILLVNAGTYDETGIPVHLKIDSAGSPIYNQLVNVPSLDSATSDTVDFPNWTPSQGGNIYQVTAWHSYTPDTNRMNDTLHRQVRVKGHDVASIVTNLTGYVRSGTPVAPTLTLADSGDYTERTFSATCWIDSAGTRVYNQTVPVDSVLLGGTRTVTFPNWTPGPDAMTYNVTLFHTLAGDQRHVNDTLRSTVATRGHSVTSVSMNVGGRVRANQAFTPVLTLRSADYTEHSVICYCWIDSSGTRVYNQNVLVDSVPYGAPANAGFPAWLVGPTGTQYDVTMFNTFADPNPGDDTLRRTTEAADQMRILVIHADGTPDSLPIGLTALGDSVDLYPGTGATPTLSQLAPYDGVIAYSNSTFQNPVALGDTLAAFVDLGKAVVIGTFAVTSGWAMQGAVMSGNYVTMIPGSNTHAAGSLGWYSSAHPIMNGVTTVTDVYRSQTSFAPGADSVAKWDDGKPYVATSPNMHVVAINNYPGYVSPERLTGRDWILVYHNALLWASGGGSGLEEKQPFSISSDFTLCQSKPNPFRDRTIISYSVPRALDVNITVYDLSGRSVATLVNGRQPAGRHAATWNRTDGTGNRVASGVYFYKLTSGNYRTTRKLVVE